MDCQAVKWPFSKDAKNFEPAALAKVARPSLYAYLYFELASQPSARTPGLAKKLFFYLSSTELNEGRSNLIQVLQTSAELDSAQPQVIQTAEICSIEARLPSSVKKQSKAKAKAKKQGAKK